MSKVKSKKVKETNKLVYKRGLAVQIRGIEERAGEYHGEEEKMMLTLHFNSKNAINNASKILGYRLGRDKKGLITNFERGYKKHDVYLDSRDVWALSIYFKFKFHIGSSGYTYEYNNDYSGARFHERVNPRDIFKGVNQRSLETYLGTVADSRGTFEEYLESVLKRIDGGHFIYCPQLL